MQSQRMALVHDPRKHALLGQYIRDTRTSVGMTQSMLASVLEKPQSYIAKIEAGERRIDVIEFIQILDVMGISIHNAVDYIKGKIL